MMIFLSQPCIAFIRFYWRHPKRRRLSSDGKRGSDTFTLGSGNAFNTLAVSVLRAWLKYPNRPVELSGSRLCSHCAENAGLVFDVTTFVTKLARTSSV